MSSDKLLGNLNGSYGQELYYDYSSSINHCPTHTVQQQQQQQSHRTNSHARGVAQERRNLENAEFKRLSSLLPVSREISEQHLDKASIVRLAKTSIRLSNAISQWKLSKYIDYGPLIETNVINLIDGFLCIFAPNFEFLYVSETISQHLGLSQVELCGNSLWNYVHLDDLPELRLSLSRLQDGLVSDLLLNFRLRSTLTKRRSRENLNCTTGYKVITMEINNISNWSLLLAFCQPHSSRISNGIRVANSWVIITNDALQITFTDIPYSSIGKRLIGQSFYKFIHPDDLHVIVGMHQKLQIIGSHHTKFVQIILNNNQYYAEIMAISSTTNKSNKSDKLNGQQNKIVTLLMNAVRVV